MSKKIYPKDNSALRVQPGVTQPSNLNPELSTGLHRFKKEKPSTEAFLKGIRAGNRSMLGRAITLIESELVGEKETARKLINLCLPYSGKSVRLGITGVPGAGKSTFIESFGLQMIARGKKVAVLAIDPSSTRTKGSILGDKTRMEALSTHPGAFVRPSATSGTLGGVARATRESIILCEAAGFDFIIVETVGVGQSETAVAQIVDFFLLLMLAGGGDELQGIKRGIMEMADLVVINKADGDNVRKAGLAKKEYENALHLFPALANGWAPQVITASAVFRTGLDAVWEQIETYVKLMRLNGWFDKHRQQQDLFLLRESINQSLSSAFFENEAIKGLVKGYKQQITEGKLSPYEAAQKLLEKYFAEMKK
ncbi:MAG: methylmalonyl Co-A mutase-associated GTPase MeaB [Bacteroidales bacterium]|nr:methylmalonyl Co-A mutase-associated GTPase MeaB [Bacteroidales bacterium]MCF6342054.1 methylmalonyl Co-A mutase-associated GTPase MeaB [Bacteroidales bacterium]